MVLILIVPEYIPEVIGAFICPSSMNEFAQKVLF